MEKKKTIARKDKDPTEVASTGIIIIAIIKKTVCAQCVRVAIDTNELRRIGEL